ncbi:hypothetical protein [Pseudotabrizicola algicola]|uniref:Uncharacterized protein n=1 Tax=Pseudotabrizicola algicola TaxID=2709381 RepID=A0A6B3RR60_9RHOB|nr:hypothetical protein [Pseudotabrizicola algicola]NEX47636.1 hypothetical protein [Pseudotabrizicola algicola]
MTKDCNLPKPARMAFRAEHLPGKGYAVFDPEGAMCGRITPFRVQAEQLRDRLQRAADLKAKRGPRPCLSCSTEFASEGIHHRLCNGCRGRSDGGSMTIAATSSGKVRRAARA